MKCLVLACDYDGTLAHDGLVVASTAAVLDRFRTSDRRLRPRTSLWVSRLR